MFLFSFTYYEITNIFNGHIPFFTSRTKVLVEI